jgi:purine-binding chemotaxis protein CheW
VKGVLNLRGSIVPVFDLRQRFDLPVQPYSKDTVVIVLRVGADQASLRSMGVVVDAVSDVLDSRVEAIRPAPDFGAAVSTQCLSGLVSAGTKMVMLLDVDRLLGEDGVASGQDAAAV